MFKNQVSFLLLSTIFFKEYLNLHVRVNKIVNEHSVNYHLNPHELTSTTHVLKFSWISYKICIIHRGWGKFWNLCFSEYWKIFFVRQIFESKHFTCAPYRPSSGKRKLITPPPKAAFFFSKICLLTKQRGREGVDYESSSSFRKSFRK